MVELPQRWMNCMELMAPRKKTVGTTKAWTASHLCQGWRSWRSWRSDVYGIHQEEMIEDGLNAWKLKTRQLSYIFQNSWKDLMWHFGGIFAPEGENRIGHGSPGHCRLALCLTQHLAPSSGCGSCIAHAGTEGQGQSTGSLSLRLGCHHRSRHHSSTWLWCFWRRMVGRLDKGAGCEGRSQEEQHSHRGEAKGSVARSRWHSVALVQLEPHVQHSDNANADCTARNAGNINVCTMY